MGACSSKPRVKEQAETHNLNDTLPSDPTSSVMGTNSAGLGSDQPSPSPIVAHQPSDVVDSIAGFSTIASSHQSVGGAVGFDLASLVSEMRDSTRDSTAAITNNHPSRTSTRASQLQTSISHTLRGLLLQRQQSGPTSNDVTTMAMMTIGRDSSSADNNATFAFTGAEQVTALVALFI